MNKVLLIGNLGADAELRNLANSKSVLNFRIATTDKWTDANGVKQEATEWHRCAMFGPRAATLAQYLTKGTKLAVEGSIKYRTYEKDGVKHYSTDINVTNVEFVGGGGGVKKVEEPGSGNEAPADEQEIPF